jgi:hypothetical protein
VVEMQDAFRRHVDSAVFNQQRLTPHNQTVRQFIDNPMYPNMLRNISAA